MLTGGSGEHGKGAGGVGPGWYGGECRLFVTAASIDKELERGHSHCNYQVVLLCRGIKVLGRGGGEVVLLVTYSPVGETAQRNPLMVIAM